MPKKPGLWPRTKAVVYVTKEMYRACCPNQLGLLQKGNSSNKIKEWEKNLGSYFSDIPKDRF